MAGKKIKLLVCGDGVVHTGFSTVLHSIIKHLPMSKYELRWLAVNYYGDPHPYRNLDIYPASLKGDIYGLRRLVEFVKWQPDIIFILNDAWVVDGYLKEIKKVFRILPKIVIYLPVDAEDHDSDWYNNFDIVNKVVAYTNFGKGVIENAARDIIKDIRIIPHGVDRSNFFHIDRNKARAELFKKFPELKDTFIFLNANRNQPRKKLDITLQAFAYFVQDKPDADVRLYMHCGNTDTSIDVLKLAQRYGIANRIINSGNYRGPSQVATNTLNLIYNACNVGLNTSTGEGWSLTNMEHAITGAPQVLVNHSALAEVFSSCNVMVDPTLPSVLDNICTTGYLVSPIDFAKGLEIIYQEKDKYDLLSAKNIEYFSQPKFQWSTISKQWDTLFSEVLESGNNISDKH